MYKTLPRTILIGIFCLFSFARGPLANFIVGPALAFTMENQNIRLEAPDVVGNPPEILPAPTPIPEENPKITVGFPENKSILPFSFTTSSLLVDHGVIAPTDPIRRTVNLIIQKGRAENGYSVFALSDHSLRILNTEEEIKDTTCDNGLCSEGLEATWVNPLTFGAGFRVDNIQGKTASELFAGSDVTFAQFADRESGESANIVMRTGRSKVENRNEETRVTFKVNVAATQAPGVYQNIINYIAVPNL